ncbi:MAG: DUF1800 family protein [Bacteroidota bacterium]
MPLGDLTGTLGKKRAAHLLRRACGGGTVEEIDAFALLTPQQAVERLFNTELPDPVLPIDPLTGEEWITSGNFQSEERELEQQFLQWHLGQMLGTGIADDIKLAFIFRERLVYFMHTHFTSKKSTQRNLSGDMRALFYQQALFRLYAFDADPIIIPPEDPNDPESTETIIPKSFKELTKKVCLDNAMLIFLDGRLNVKGSVNENFARELLELYSIGRGLEGTNPEPEFDGDYFVFTEQDVQEGAKVLSGFNVDLTFTTLDEETGLPRGQVRGSVNNANRHEEGVKTLSDRLGGGIITPNAELTFAGRSTEASVIDEISQLVNLIYEQDETSLAICRELYRFFVYSQVDQSLQDDIIQEMAMVFAANDYQIQPVLERLFTSLHFYEAEPGNTDNNFGSIIKSPIELVLGFARNFNLTIPDYETELERFGELAGYHLNQIDGQGMDYYEPFEVAGYAAYHQFPIYNRNWISTNYLANRYQFIEAGIADENADEVWQVNVVEFVRSTFPTEAPNARELIIAIAEHFLPIAENLSFDPSSNGDLTQERLNYFLNAFLFSPQIDGDPEAQWTNRWVNNIDPTTVANQLKNLFNAMLQTPEYQLM